MYALHCTVEHEDRTAENERARTTSVSPMHAGNLVLKQGENKFFWAVTVALAKAYAVDRPGVIM